MTSLIVSIIGLAATYFYTLMVAAEWQGETGYIGRHR